MPRVPPHFKVRTSIKNHAKMAAVYRDDKLLAAYVRLGVEAIERFADRTGDTFILDERDLMGCTATERRDSARRVLDKLVTCSPLVYHFSEGLYHVHIPNLAKKQGFRPRNGSGMEVSATTTATTTAKPPIKPPFVSAKEKKKTPARRPATTFPEGGLSTEQKRELAASPSLKDLTPSQFQHACQAVRDWATGNEKGPHRRVDWVATVRNAINRGWALEGYGGSTGNGKGSGRGSSNYVPPYTSPNWEDKAAPLAAQAPESEEEN